MAVSQHVCGRCGHEFCTECVLFPFGLSKAPMCISCALEAGGIRRQHTGRPRLAPRIVKQRVAEHNRRTPVVAPEPEPEPVTDDDDEAWLSGDARAEESGGWSQTY